MDPIELQLQKEEKPDLESLLEYNDIVRKTFASEEEGFEFYNNYGYGKGFSVRRSYCEWDNGHNEMIHRKFICSREGFREEKHLNRVIKKRRPRRITRVGCRAKFVIARHPNLRQWYVKDFIDEHNHPMAPADLICLLRSHKRISDEQKAEIVEMEISGIRKHRIMDILEMQYGGYDKVGFTTRDLYNFCHRYEGTITAGDVQTVISYLTEQKRTDPDFFFKYMVDAEGHLTGLFWCDSQCLLDYEAFGDVVVFDSTYKTNRYNVPLVPFVGVNHHRSTVIFGCGIISHEDTESYVWMLTTFSEAMIQKHPNSVITDGDLAMAKAIRLVWPNSSHRLCVWHIERSIVRNVKDDGVKDVIRTFLYDCCSLHELESKWLKFLNKNKVTNKDSWLYQMYDMREIWCAAYHVGLRSNETKLDIDALQSKEGTEPVASTIETEAAKSFTPTVFGIVQFSIKAAKKCYSIEIEDGDNMRTYMVGRKDKEGMMYYVKCEFSDEGNLKVISCSCDKLQSIGTPCSHIFFVLGDLNEDKLPNCCVLKRWTMGAKSAFPPKRKSVMYDYSDCIQRYRELRNISLTATFAASCSPESYDRLKRVLHDEATMNLPNGADNTGKRYGPVLPQAPAADCVAFSHVLDPVQVPGKGAPKKKFKVNFK